MLNIFKYYSYRIFVDDYIKERKKINPAFGLRSFAKKIGISPGQLSQIIKGKKNISKEHAEILTKEFKLKVDEKSFFTLLTSFDHEESEIKEIILKSINVERSRKLISEIESTVNFSEIRWKHLFVLSFIESGMELLSLKAVILRCLEIEINEFNSIIQDLVNKELISHNGKNIEKKDKRFVLSSSESSKTLKNIHSEYLSENIKRVYTKTPLDRYSVTEFVTIPTDKFEEAKKITNNYLDELASLETSDSQEIKVVLGISLHLNRF